MLELGFDNDDIDVFFDFFGVETPGMPTVAIILNDTELRTILDDLDEEHVGMPTLINDIRDRMAERDCVVVIISHSL